MHDRECFPRSRLDSRDAAERELALKYLISENKLNDAFLQYSFHLGT